MQSTLQAARQDLGERAGRRMTADWIGVGALTALVAAGYIVFVMAQYYTFRISADDLLIFDQGVRSYAHFHLGISPFIGYHLSFGPDYSLLGNHWSPILAALAPVYWIWNSPITLLVAQAVLFALAIPWIWVFTRRAFGGGPKATVAAYLVSIAYAISWPLASALVFQFHEVAFAPVLMAVALERLQAGRLRAALIALGLLLLVKEDMGLFVAGIGAYLAVSHRIVTRQRLVGLVADRGRGGVHLDRDRRADPGVRRARQLLLVVYRPRQQRPAGRVARGRPPAQHPAHARHAAGQARHHALAVRSVLLPVAAVADRDRHDPVAARAHAGQHRAQLVGDVLPLQRLPRGRAGLRRRGRRRPARPVDRASQAASRGPARAAVRRQDTSRTRHHGRHTCPRGDARGRQGARDPDAGRPQSRQRSRWYVPPRSARSGCTWSRGSRSTPPCTGSSTTGTPGWRRRPPRTPWSRAA